MPEPLLEVDGLTTQFFTDDGRVVAVSDLDLTLNRGEVLGIVGESGSGKSVLALSLANLLASPGRITAGSIWLHDASLANGVRDTYPDAVDGHRVDLRELPPSIRRGLRGTTISMIFQDAESSFNPSLTVGEQLAEAAEVQRRALSRPRESINRNPALEYSLTDYLLSLTTRRRKFISSESRDKAVELLEQVGIPDPVERADQYPHEFSGGMLQRAMIAQALAGEPSLLIADEPTTALDVTIQAQVLDLLADLQEQNDMTVMLITHDLGVVARMCERVGVMYAGEIVERGTVTDIFDRTAHPYTKGLLGSLPDLDAATERLEPIPGNVPSLLAAEMEDRCYFADRCPKAMEQCLEKPTSMAVSADGTHSMTCWLADMEYGDSPPLPANHFSELPIHVEESLDD